MYLNNFNLTLFKKHLIWIVQEAIEKLKEGSQKLIAQVKTIESECQTTNDKFTKSFTEVDSKVK